MRVDPLQIAVNVEIMAGSEEPELEKICHKLPIQRCVIHYGY